MSSTHILRVGRACVLPAVMPHQKRNPSETGTSSTVLL